MSRSTRPHSGTPRPLSAVLPLAALLLLVLSVRPASGQTVQGRLVDAEAGSPLEGAIVTLVDSAGRAAANTLTNGVGLFSLEAPGPGSYVLRAERIGFASALSDTLRLAAGDTVTHRMETRFEPVALEGISVESAKRCEVRPREGMATSRVWDEARKALEAAAWARDRTGYRYRILNHERVLGPEGREVREERRERVQGFARNPITSRPAEELLGEGFARQVEGGDWMYYAPDARVLLSDAFLDTHCMALRRGEDEREGLLGLRFEPVEGRRAPEIAGTFWLAPATGRLQRLDYRYVNMESRLEVDLTDEVGGEVVFQGLPNGAWIVREWRIRMPLVGRQGRPGQYRRVNVLAALHEVGGLVQRVQDEEGRTVMSAEMATVTGVVVDSTGMRPLEGATVRVQGTERSARTDADGRFRLAELRGGTYRLTYGHPTLEAVGYSPEPREVHVERGRAMSVRFRAPSRGEALARACRDERGTEVGEEIGAVLGFVRESESGAPVPDARVEVLWSDWGFRATVEEDAAGNRTLQDYRIDQDRWGADTRTDDTGFYSVCGVPTRQLVELFAGVGPIRSDPVEVRYLQHDLPLPVSSTVTVAGGVVDFESGEPLAGARVELIGPGVEAETDSVGRFRMEEVPLGRHPVSVTYGDWSGVADTVAVRGGGPTGLEIRVPTEAIPVEGVTATVEVLSEEDRRFRSRGRAEDYTGPGELATIAEKARDFAGVLREMGSPRIEITDARGDVGAGFCIKSTRPTPGMRQQAPNTCRPMLVILDGSVLQDIPAGVGGGLVSLSTATLRSLNPADVQSVRVLTPIEGQFRYGNRGRNGVVIVETRRENR